MGRKPKMKTTDTKKTLGIVPAAGYLIIEPVSAQNKTASGLYLPESVDEKPQKGKVLAVGASDFTDHGAEKKSPVEVGDMAIYKKWGGNEVKVDGKEYLFVKFEDVLGIEK